MLFRKVETMSVDFSFRSWGDCVVLSEPLSLPRSVVRLGTQPEPRVRVRCELLRAVQAKVLAKPHPRGVENVDGAQNADEFSLRGLNHRECSGLGAKKQVNGVCHRQLWGELDDLFVHDTKDGPIETLLELPVFGLKTQCLPQVTFGDEADEAVLFEDRQVPNVVAIEHLERLTNVCARGDRGHRARHQIFDERRDLRVGSTHGGLLSTTVGFEGSEAPEAPDVFGVAAGVLSPGETTSTGHAA